MIRLAHTSKNSGGTNACHGEPDSDDDDVDIDLVPLSPPLCPRLYMSGWRNNPRLPDGLDYEGHGRRQLYGETGVTPSPIDTW
jgi:hypothetical protein